MDVINHGMLSIGRKIIHHIVKTHNNRTVSQAIEARNENRINENLAAIKLQWQACFPYLSGDNFFWLGTRLEI